MIRWALPVVLAGCLKAGSYPLDASKPMPRSPEFQVGATAIFQSQPASGSDLRVDLNMTFTGSTPARVNLMKVWWKVDGVSWQRCRHGKGTDKDSLIFQIEPGKTRTFELTCQDIPRPYRSVDLKFHTAGTGSMGVVELAFEGIPRPL